MWKYANRVGNMRGSATRAMMSMKRDPDLISFAGGLPAPEVFPVEDYERVALEVIQKEGRIALQYGPAEGYGPLREKIAERMAKSGVLAEKENILITSGSQQGLEFTAKMLIDPGDIIVCESPSYLGAMTAFNSYEPEYIEIPTDEDGMDMEELERALASQERIRFIYVIPDFQNPSGKTWSLSRRKQLVALANQYDVVVLEDNPYGELCFEGEMLPAVKHFDTEERVIFLGTFSKIFSPGLRIGWVTASAELVDKYNLIKQGADLQSSTISQMELNRYLEVCDIEAHIDRIKKVYKRRRDLMLEGMKKEFPPEITYTCPRGGLFIWVELPLGMDAADVSVRAMDNRVAFIVGEAFFPNGGDVNHFRMNFSNMNEEQIVEGVKRLGQVLREMGKECDEKKGGTRGEF